MDKIKEYRWENYFINPTIEDPEKYLEYDLMSGKIIPKEKDIQKIEYKKAVVTIELLNLNHPRLCNMRKNFIRECLCSFDCVKYYDNFPTLKKQIIKGI